MHHINVTAPRKVDWALIAIMSGSAIMGLLTLYGLYSVFVLIFR